MKMSDTSPHSTTSCVATSHTVRGFVIACALSGVLGIAQDAAAKCNPQVPRSCAQPEQSKPYQAKTLDQSAVSYADKKPHSPPPIYEGRPQGFHGPVGPGPRHATGSSESKSGSHGIIFVGGHSVQARDKAALNPQPIPPGHSALNPQPIPPGHSLRKPLPPSAPIEKIGH